MEEFVNNSESGATIDNDSSQGQLISPFFKSHNVTENYGIAKFPKEFKKDFIRSIDFRFTIILIFSLLVHTLGILYLEKKYPPEYDSETISRLQKQYVDLLLTDEPVVTEFITPVPNYTPVEEPEPETISSISEWMETFADNTLKSIKDMPGFDPDVPKIAGRSTPKTTTEVEELLSKDLSEIVQENMQKGSESAAELTSVGLLGMIGSKSEMADQELVDDILGYADLNDDHLASVLSKLSSIQVPRHNTAEYILNQRKKAEEMQHEKVKGGRYLANQDRIKLAGTIQPLEPAKTEEMERRIEFEEVPDSPLAKLRNPAADQTQRTAQNVIKVVQSHKPALQDCYKQELKINPNLRGKIVVRFVVDPEGKVVDASVVSSTLKSAAMESCLLRRIKNWKDFGYGDPAAGNVIYKQAFNFGN